MDVFFIDTEITTDTKIIKKVGYWYPPADLEGVTTSLTEVRDKIAQVNPRYIAGHNFLSHDAKYLRETKVYPALRGRFIIDTMLVSMLLFPNKSTHKITKPYKTDINIENCPLQDCQQTEALLRCCLERFATFSVPVGQALALLLRETVEYRGFFNYLKLLNVPNTAVDLADLFADKVTADHDEIAVLLEQNPIEMAILLVFLHCPTEADPAAISRVILHRFPRTQAILEQLQRRDFTAQDLQTFAQNEFGMARFEFRNFNKRDGAGLWGKKQLSQEEIVQAALQNKSLLAILPTGGGKTITFQIPALIKAQSYKGLTVVISPLQALMKDQINSFREKNQNFKVVAISGFLSSVERLNAIEEVKNGIVDILYIAPEMLRTNSIFKALQSRYIERFVIDEAHCISAWGHDFRHDYHYIPHFIKDLQKKSHQKDIAVSCFTATAKPEVLDEIKKVFMDKLDLPLEEFYASAQRDNLAYRAIKADDDNDKYQKLVEILLENGNKPTIIYLPQNARQCRELSEQLVAEDRLLDLGLEIEPFYAAIDEQIENGEREGRNKSQILADFIDNKINIVVATTAFGMGIDKPDIKTVIHYEVSDSLESYLQESGRGGRGGRSESIEANCIVLFSTKDFNRMFDNLNRTKVEASEIQRIVQVIRRHKINPAIMSVKQIADAVGIDTADSSVDYRVLVNTAILELEQHDIIRRERNSTKIYATAVRGNTKNTNQMEFIQQKLANYKRSNSKLYEPMIRIMGAVIGRSKTDPIELDDLSDNLGLERDDVHHALEELAKNELIDMGNDISVYIKKTIESKLKKHFKIENRLVEHISNLPDYQNEIDLRALGDDILDKEVTGNPIRYFKKTLQSFTHLARVYKQNFSVHFRQEFAYFKEKEDIKTLIGLVKFRQKIGTAIVQYLLQQGEGEVEFASTQLKIHLEVKFNLEEKLQQFTTNSFHHILVYLSDVLRADFQLRKGRLIYHTSLVLQKKEAISQPTPYQVRAHYNHSLKSYYQRKIQAIHILIEFYRRLLNLGWAESKEYITHYFSLPYQQFITDYKFDKKMIALSVTRERYSEILTDLNDEQKKVFEDKKTRAILVIAGPGSGKTKTLVHKIASLITIENQKPEYFLMLTHGRVAANEFRQRLVKLVGNLGHQVQIMTFHAYALLLLGKRLSDNLNIGDVIGIATQRIKTGKITPPAKSILVLDEYQDVSEKTFNLIMALWDKMPRDKKIIAVGDDDQCINNFNGSDRADTRFMQEFGNRFATQIDEASESVRDNSFKQYNLLTNYRSKQNIVGIANQFATTLPNRIKNAPLIAHEKQDGLIKIVQHRDSKNMVASMAQDIIDDESDNIAVLCQTNEEVMAIYSIVKAAGVQAKYLTTQDGFRLGDLQELQFFAQQWQEHGYNAADYKLNQRFANSRHYRLAKSVIDRFLNFESHSGKQASGQFTQYLKEIEFDEFEQTKAKVIVSTMHKAKGKEFSSVYALIKNNLLGDDYTKRLVYVAMTRAKNKLYLHTERQCLAQIESYADEVTVAQHQPYQNYPIVLTMSLKDLHLSNDDALKGIKANGAMAGDKVEIYHQKVAGRDKFILRKNGQLIGVLSQPDAKNERLGAKILNLKDKGYSLNKTAEIEYMVKWYDKKQDKKQDKFYLQALCQIFMQK